MVQSAGGEHLANFRGVLIRGWRNVARHGARSFRHDVYLEVCIQTGSFWFRQAKEISVQTWQGLFKGSCRGLSSAARRSGLAHHDCLRWRIKQRTRSDGLVGSPQDMPKLCGEPQIKLQISGV